MKVYEERKSWKNDVPASSQFGSESLYAIINAEPAEIPNFATFARAHVVSVFMGPASPQSPTLVESLETSTGICPGTGNSRVVAHLDRVVSLGSLDERDKIADRFGSQKIHRRSGNVRE